ncbi:MAG: amidohydrolase [Candidatus Thermoplasmatota archaeon]|nr:amidohydrolase [Candidatus Thermoplasmatota archaeon]
MDILIKDAFIITQDRYRNIRHGDIYIEGDVISEVSERISTEAEYVISEKKLVMPGLINTHTHLPMTLMRGYGDDLSLEKWLTEKIWPVEKKLNKRLVQAGVSLALLEMIATGTTSLADMYFFEDAIAGVCKKMGMRAYAGFSIIDFDTAEMKKEQMLPECEKFIKKWGNDRLVTPVVAPHSAYSCSPETLQKASELAKKYDVFLHTHCSETRKEVYDIMERYGCRPLEQLKRNGVLTEKTILAHCGWITKEEVREISTANSCVSHNPVSNMKLATGGFTPLPELFENNATVTLGTDGAASNNKLDMFETMKFAALIHKHYRWNPSIVTAQQTLDMATINAAKFLGIDGSIEEGKKADVIVLDMNVPNLTPMHNPVSHIVYAASGFNVSDVIIDGKMIMKDKSFIAVDKNKILEEAEEAKKELTA